MSKETEVQVKKKHPASFFLTLNVFKLAANLRAMAKTAGKQRVEIVVLGDPGCGKNRLCYQFWNTPMEKFNPTTPLPNFEIKSKIFGTSQVGTIRFGISTRLTLHCWNDKEEDLVKTVKGKRFFLIVFNIRSKDSYKNLRQWVNLIEKNALKTHYFTIVGLEPGTPNGVNINIPVTQTYFIPENNANNDEDDDDDDDKGGKKKKKKKKKIGKLSKKELQELREVGKKEAKKIAAELKALDYYEIDLSSKTRVRFLFYWFVQFAISAHTAKFYEEKKKKKKNKKKKGKQKSIDDLLKELELQDYLNNFKSSKVIYNDLRNLDDEDLEELIPDKIPRKRFKKYIEEHIKNNSEQHTGTGSGSGGSEENEEIQFNFGPGKDTMEEFKKEKWYLNKEYIIKKDVIGSGTYGVVKRGSYVFGRSKTDIAIKEMILASGSQRDNVIREVKLVSSFDHPNVIRCLGAYFEDRIMNVVLEYCESGDLSDYKINLITDKDKINCLMQIARGMKYLHYKDMIHRDLKPQNILVKQGNFIICDFGTTKDADSVGNTFCGTLAYIPPEQLNQNSSKPAGKKTDVYAFAVIMWEVFTGKEAFTVDSDGNQLSKFIKIHQKNTRPDISLITNSQLAELIKRCWSVDPEERPHFKEIIKTLKIIKETLK